MSFWFSDHGDLCCGDREQRFTLGFPLFRVVMLIAIAVTFGMLLVGCKPTKSMPKPFAGMKAGEERVLGIGHGVNLKFHWVPAGKFMMGSPLEELGRSEGETRKPVRIKDGFWIAEHETTVLTWLKVMGIERPSISMYTAKKPVTYVSWFDCREFIERLKSPAPGWKYELPTEEQWEYACRAGSQGSYASQPTEMGWLVANSGGSCHAVGTKAANAWSIHDMHGNVAEWCRDLIGPKQAEAAIRGGSWASDFTSRAAARNSDTPFLRINRVGFRLVLVNEVIPGN